MASSTPTTPSRRSVSLPPRSDSRTSSQNLIEVLYRIPSARIISFSTSNATPRPSSSNGSPAGEEELGNLSWQSRSERTIAVGTHFFAAKYLPSVKTEG
jgi:hypothetical protein